MTVAGADLETVDLPLGELREWTRNPRKISKPRLEQLKRALEAEPHMLRAHPLIALPDGTVVAGNQRLRAARELGWPSLPVVVVDLDEARAAEWALRDNQGYGEDDEAAVGALLAELAGAGRDLDLTGYGSADVDRLLAAVAGPPLTDPDDAPPVPAAAKSVRGEVYELGPHRLMCGDATSEADVVALVGADVADLVWTDPPYGVGYADKNRMLNAIAPGNRIQTPIVGDHGTVEDLEVLLRASLTLALASSRPGACWFVAAPGMAQPLRAFVLVLCELDVWRNTIVWVKDGHVLGRTDYHGQHEHLLYGWTPGAGHNRPPTRSETSVWLCPRPKSSDLHPTTKPVALIERSLLNHTERDDVALDPFAGAGSTLIACEMHARRALCMEIDPAYCDVIRQRYADFTGQPHLAP